MSGNAQMTAAVTGASGYLGGIVADRLAQEGWETVKLVRNASGRTCRRFVLGPPSRPTSYKVSASWSTAPMTWQ